MVQPLASKVAELREQMRLIRKKLTDSNLMTVDELEWWGTTDSLLDISVSVVNSLKFERIYGSSLYLKKNSDFMQNRPFTC